MFQRPVTHLALPLAPLLLAVQATPAQQLALQADLNLTPTDLSSEVAPAGAAHEPMPELAGHRYFLGRTIATGVELFRTDGTAAGTSLVADVRPGPAGSAISHLREAGGRLWFQANDGVHGRELWTTDGTAAGTTLVADLNPGGDSDPAAFTALGSAVLFVADDGATGRELWTTDGTAAGTTRLTDLAPGAADGLPVDALTLSADGSWVLFRGDAPGTGNEPHCSDGTVPGTVLVRDVRPGLAGSWQPGDDPAMVTFAGSTWFGADDGSGVGVELWSTDGTYAGSAMLADLAPGPADLAPGLSEAAIYKGELWFPAEDGNVEVWSSDGTATGTAPLLDIQPAGSSNPTDLIQAGGYLYFVADGGLGRELYRTGGHPINTTLVADLASGTGSSFLPKDNQLIAQGTSLTFVTHRTGHFTEVWTTSGTITGTQQLILWPADVGVTWLASLTPGPAGDALLLNQDSAGQRELLAFDGSYPVFVPVAELEPAGGTADSSPILEPVGGSHVLVLAPDAPAGSRVWRWDPAAGAVPLAPGLAAAWEIQPQDPVTGWLQGKLQTAFVVTTDVGGTTHSQLWLTDGTDAGTHLIHDDWRPIERFALAFHPTQQRLYFGRDAAVSAQLWVTDGTQTGTVQLHDKLFEDPAVGYPELAVAGDRLLFVTTSPTIGIEPWISDGTTAGTKVLKDLRPGFLSSFPYQLTQAGDHAVFWGYTNGKGSEPMITDGTTAGTQLLVELLPGASSSNVSEALAVGDLLYVCARDLAHGFELWVLDTQTGVATFLADTVPGATSGYPTELTAVGSRVFFRAPNPAAAAGAEGALWVTNGTPAGTHVVVDLWDGPEDLGPRDLVAGSDGLYFTAGAAATGLELYHSDGTAAGTALVQDLMPGPESSEPAGPVPFDDRILMTATDQVHGRELFALVQPGALSRSLGSAGSHATLSVTPPVLGGSAELHGSHAPAGSIGILGMGLAQDLPHATWTLPGDLGWLDPFGAAHLAVVQPPSWTSSLPVPAAPTLDGIVLHLQTWYPSTTGLPAATSNAVRMTLGL